MACEKAGLLGLVNDRVVQKISWATLGHNDHARVLLADRSRRGLWLGFAKGGLAYLTEGRVQQTYSEENGLGHGRVNGLRFGSGGALWAATEGGLSRILDGRVATLSVKNGLPCNAVHWSMEDDSRSMWAYMECGLVRITRPELDAWVANPDRSVKLTLFDNSDGVRSHSYPTEVHSVSKSSDGKIWFAAFDGVNILNPRRLHLNTVPPPVHIQSIKADGKTYPLETGMRLPPLVRDVFIDFTALSVSAPERIRFRYMLEGQDSSWKEVANERQVRYTNLPSGPVSLPSYRLQQQRSLERSR